MPLNGLFLPLFVLFAAIFLLLGALGVLASWRLCLLPPGAHATGLASDRLEILQQLHALLVAQARAVLVPAVAVALLRRVQQETRRARLGRVTQLHRVVLAVPHREGLRPLGGG